MCITRVIAITGCDCGLGWALAARSAREGLITVAGMFNGTDTKAAKALKEFSALPFPLDVTRSESIEDFKGFVDRLLKENPSYRLYAVVNNAGVMTIGDFEWQTPQMIEQTIDVNLLGTMRVISAFLPELRKTALEENALKPRLINVASHCGLQPLPGFGPYSASKAAVLALTRSLRYELGSFGVRSVAFVPGGFIGASNLVSKQTENTEEMFKNLNEEQKSFYSQRLKALTNYLRPVANENGHDSLKQENLIETFMNALTDENPKKLYKVECWRYKFYYNLMKLPLPETAHNWIVKKFINFPKE